MSSKPEEYAFPKDNLNQIQGGLTKREYYTAMVLQGVLANSSLATKFWFRNTEDIDCLVNSSVVIADRLIEQLDKEGVNE